MKTLVIQFTREAAAKEEAKMTVGLQRHRMANAIALGLLAASMALPQNKFATLNPYPPLDTPGNPATDSGPINLTCPTCNLVWNASGTVNDCGGNPACNTASVMVQPKRIRVILYGDSTWAANALPLINAWASGIGGSGLMGTLSGITAANGYEGGAAGSTPFKNAFTFSGVSLAEFVAASAASYTHGAALTDALVQQIIKDAVNQSLLPLDVNSVYTVLTSPDVTETSGGSAFCVQFCGYHTHFTFNSVDVKYAFVGDASTQCPTGCIVQASPGVLNSPNGNPGIDGAVSVMTHELAEAATDPVNPPGTGWWNSTGTACTTPPNTPAGCNQYQGYENGDMCNFTFGGVSGSAPAFYNQTWGGKNWLIQEMWRLDTKTCVQHTP